MSQAAASQYGPGQSSRALYHVEAGVIVRDVGIPGHLRVSAGTEAETTALVVAIISTSPSMPPRITPYKNKIE